MAKIALGVNYIGYEPEGQQSPAHLSWPDGSAELAAAWLCKRPGRKVDQITVTEIVEMEAYPPLVPKEATRRAR